MEDLAFLHVGVPTWHRLLFTKERSSDQAGIAVVAESGGLHASYVLTHEQVCQLIEWLAKTRS